jgi:hypothetical protein
MAADGGSKSKKLKAHHRPDADGGSRSEKLKANPSTKAPLLTMWSHSMLSWRQA